MNLYRVFSLSLFIIAFSISSRTQVLVSYGGTQVTKSEFLRAFSKNNTDKHPTEKVYRDYLELFTRFKLKVKAAYDLKLDTLPAQQSELENFKEQVSETYLRDESSYRRLVDEAFKRSQRDIRLAHIFIPLMDTSIRGASSTADTARAGRLAKAAYDELKEGRDFSQVARKYSADSSVQTNGGDIGYITVFTLPYDLENIAYNTPPGKFSTPFRSGLGYHIFKKLSDRPATGRIKIAQILFAFPPGVSQEIKSLTRLRADSVYHLLKAGASFGDMAGRFSNDNSSYLNDGELPGFGVGTFAPAFEDPVFALPANGALSQPILTEQGYHIVKRLDLNKVNTDASNDSAMTALKQQVLTDSRLNHSKRIMARNLARLTGFKQADVPAKLLWTLADSSLAGSDPLKARTMAGKTRLFSFPGRSIYVSEWISKLQNLPFGTHQIKAYQEQLDLFRDEKILEYYRDHLERYNPGFAALVMEFKEGNLLFEIMQRYVWDKASADSSGLEAYYRLNRKKYLPKTFEDAKGFVLNDYQDYLEELWVRSLKSKYPVHVNEAVFRTLWK